MKIIHISQQRFNFIVKQGYRFAMPAYALYGDGSGTLETIESPNDAEYHVLGSELAYCVRCDAMHQSVDTNSPAELEIVKSFPLDKAMIMLRDQRQSDILTVREHLTTCNNSEKET